MDIQGLTAVTMEILLDFVYTETVLVTVENVQELLPAACLLQLKGEHAHAHTQILNTRSHLWCSLQGNTHKDAHTHTHTHS